MSGYYAPCDPDCPEYSAFVNSVTEDPMTRAYGIGGEIVEDFGRWHRSRCRLCEEYGAANIEVE